MYKKKVVDGLEVWHSIEPDYAPSILSAMIVMGLIILITLSLVCSAIIK